MMKSLNPNKLWVNTLMNVINDLDETSQCINSVIKNKEKENLSH